MVDFDRELPIKGYIITFPNDEEQVWCKDCYEDSAFSGTLFTKVIRKGQFRAGKSQCDDCQTIV